MMVGEKNNDNSYRSHTCRLCLKHKKSKVWEKFYLLNADSCKLIFMGLKTYPLSQESVPLHFHLKCNMCATFLKHKLETML